MENSLFGRVFPAPDDVNFDPEQQEEEELQQAEEELNKLSKTLDEPVGTPSPGGTAGEELD